jgi:hypothetical protein
VKIWSKDNEHLADLSTALTLPGQMMSLALIHAYEASTAVVCLDSNRHLVTLHEGVRDQKERALLSTMSDADSATFMRMDRLERTDFMKQDSRGQTKLLGLSDLERDKLKSDLESAKKGEKNRAVVLRKDSSRLKSALASFSSRASGIKKGVRQDHAWHANFGVLKSVCNDKFETELFVVEFNGGKFLTPHQSMALRALVDQFPADGEVSHKEYNTMYKKLCHWVEESYKKEEFEKELANCGVKFLKAHPARALEVFSAVTSGFPQYATRIKLSPTGRKLVVLGAAKASQGAGKPLCRVFGDTGAEAFGWRRLLRFEALHSKRTTILEHLVRTADGPSSTPSIRSYLRHVTGHCDESERHRMSRSGFFQNLNGE